MTFRSITSVQIIVAHGIELGIDENVLLQGSGLTSAQLADHERLIEDKQELQVLNNLMLTTECPVKVGMELGCRYHLTSYGIMGYALLASSTARKAIEFGLRYLDLTYVFSQITLTELNDDLSLRFSCDISGKLGELVLVRDMLGAAMIQREVFERNGLPIKLQFMSPQPVGLCLEGIKQKLGAEIQFNASYNGFSGLAPLLDLPLVKANEATARLCEAQCSQLLQQKQNWKPVAKLVKDTLVHLGLTASMEDIAQHLARTTRTLHRQLKLEQTSWRQVRDDVRFGIAEELLLKPMQLDEIAERLGFSDGANFSHSFKRCKNITPSQYRKQATKQR
ncbi:AraC family transcriptional regulator ligand-binding domain-containing protein [Shewanella sp. SG44-6]|uniref:AraC family transcriptional regulator n=1 Tax=Shewanella sp. SG44-6 TaxID=2760959 RepID=UPI001603181E|nr:AraC family transcriptional regulator [Shewanella sp. SG44-6]MBB1389253.1 AraC family transcriptional regulator ligand-binding domain-containing protein [Shewanella sp. SG44-6]